MSGGSCKVYDFAWQDWASGQVERVWDLMDISILQAAKEGRDPLYKTSVNNCLAHASLTQRLQSSLELVPECGPQHCREARFVPLSDAVHDTIHYEPRWPHDRTGGSFFAGSPH
jgi:hypothetical protein